VDKFTVEVPTKFTPEQERFLRKQSERLGLNSRSAYIRHLVDLDRQEKAHDLNLLADSLGAKVIHESPEIPVFSCAVAEKP